ncbi:MAG: homoserine dehydrogenase [Lachnospiraceae bacterium]|nr:homoserine dehydrogenase [Lachnospiraceae bacterium]
MKVAVLGYGTVGSGVVEIINRNRAEITKRTGEEIEVKYVLDLRDFPGDAVEKVLVHDFAIVANDPEVETVVETMGGVKPAYEFVKECLLKGKNVCTSNKELVAKHGAELIAIAKEKNINFFFEASVGGGIPIIRPLIQSITADEILEIQGILNGTTNYILTKMEREGLGFDEVLKEAQAKGFAERNPDADIKGYDAGRKLAILTSLAYGKQVDFEDIEMEGIENITSKDFEYAKALGAKIKLLASSKKVNDKYYASVLPRMVNEDNQLFSVNYVLNSILVKGNVLGDVMFYGSGAGKLPTASAVVSDVVDTLVNRGRNIKINWSSEKLEISKPEGAVYNFFVRVAEDNKSKAKELFGEVREVKAALVENEYAFITDAITEAEFKKKAEKIEIISRIRTEFK